MQVWDKKGSLESLMSMKALKGTCRLCSEWCSEPA